MNEDKRYNGWKNYATWRVQLEICSDLIESYVSDLDAGYNEPFEDVHALVHYLEEDVDQAITGWGEIDDSSLAVSYARTFANEASFWEIAERAVRDYPQLIADAEEEHNDEEDDEDEG